MNTFGPDDKIWTLRREYLNALWAAEHKDIVEEKPQTMINHMLKKLIPQWLYLRMKDILNWQRNKNFHEEDYNRFVLEVAFLAKKIQSKQWVKFLFAQSERWDGDHKPRKTHHTKPARHTIKHLQRPKDMLRLYAW